MSWLVVLRPVRGIFDQDDRAEVEAIVTEDPAVTGGIMTAEIRPYRISVR